MTQGQITQQSERCKIIKKTITTFNPKTILEIGTWKGMGSTKCILDSIDESVEFISLESNLEFFEIARYNLSSYSSKFKQIYGRIIEVDEVIEFSKEVDLSTEQRTWLDEDINNFNKCENVFHVLPNFFDLILLDGGEFSTYPEWTKLKSQCKIILLDDINVLKCNKIFNELVNDSNYELLDKTDEGHGFCCFYKKN